MALQQRQRHHQDYELSAIQRKAQFKAFPKTGFFSSGTNPATPSSLSGAARDHRLRLINTQYRRLRPPLPPSIAENPRQIPVWEKFAEVLQLS